MVDSIIPTIQYIEQSITVITVATHVAICFAYNHLKSRSDAERKELLEKAETTQFLISDCFDEIQKIILSIHDGRTDTGSSADEIYAKALSRVKEALRETGEHDTRDISATAEAICEESIRRNFNFLFSNSQKTPQRDHHGGQITSDAAS